ncbi:MAG: molecular chaperone HtpG, partial [Campylobacterales bacterium]|nr:molecular chaperone HtpG [Campylobacterales bacterium]
MSKHQFQAEINKLLHLMIHSLYSNKEIFLRELVSNSSDALDKLQYLTITDDNYKNLSFTPKIEIVIDKNLKCITISDTGIGMNDQDLMENLGTIAKSGTKSFVEKLSGDAKKDSNLIGQFGVGFYSAFMVARKIEVLSKKAGEEKAFRWISEGAGEYDIVEASKKESGTEIKLFLKDDEDEFLSEYKIESIIKKYSNHIPFAIYLEKEKDGKKEFEQINKASALWRVSKSELKDEDYIDFYKVISHDSDEPLMWNHTKAEGTLEYTTLFYIPKKAPLDMFRADYQAGIKLYVKRVFITDNDKELMPTYLRFLRGVIDAEDLPLNVSREILQQNQILAKIRKNSVKKVLSEIKKLSENEEKYESFYKEFGRVLKEGVYTDYENKEALLELLRFKSTKSDKKVSLDEYISRMKESQKAIYFITGEDANTLKYSPLIEKLKADDIEVLLLDDEIDSIIMPTVFEYKTKQLKSVNNGEIDEKTED